ncbi:MAG: hypothetical protein ACM3WU_03660 [Bacillota bacterium]
MTVTVTLGSQGSINAFTVLLGCNVDGPYESREIVTVLDGDGVQKYHSDITKTESVELPDALPFSSETYEPVEVFSGYKVRYAHYITSFVVPSAQMYFGEYLYTIP